MKNRSKKRIHLCLVLVATILGVRVDASILQGTRSMLSSSSVSQEPEVNDNSWMFGIRRLNKVYVGGPLYYELTLTNAGDAIQEWSEWSLDPGGGGPAVWIVLTRGESVRQLRPYKRAESHHGSRPVTAVEQGASVRYLLSLWGESIPNFQVPLDAKHNRSYFPLFNEEGDYQLQVELREIGKTVLRSGQNILHVFPSPADSLSENANAAWLRLRDPAWLVSGRNSWSTKKMEAKKALEKYVSEWNTTVYADWARLSLAWSAIEDNGHLAVSSIEKCRQAEETLDVAERILNGVVFREELRGITEVLLLRNQTIVERIRQRLALR